MQLEQDEAIAASQQFLTYMQMRHSVRDYADTPVPEEVIENAIAAAGTAPSGANQQPGILWPFKTLK